MGSHDRCPPKNAAPPGSPDVRARVVVADDHARMLGHLGRLLEKEFTVAGLILDAALLVDEWPLSQPDVIVLDISMPGCTGFEAAARLRAAGCQVPIVFVSVHEAPDMVTAAWAAGGAAYVAKRDLVADLVPAIHAALRGRRFVSASIDSP
jgi:DNA-binding NarL/FixJ family response regulator